MTAFSAAQAFLADSGPFKQQHEDTTIRRSTSFQVGRLAKAGTPSPQTI
ncbi:MAG: hypothetical protein NZ570_00355 [Candidatus Caldarchaeum sp.]|nr:hypothetical protein [Candidatus Caldarchaeum sp.]MCS7137800.1 hypothetical protein [Candidatus Caldarchaeum sp.]MDW8359515.1 hypothetical protein [Candidatus Caldarchaeum sp.]